MNTLVELLGESVEPGASRVGSSGVEVVQEDICWDWWKVFQGAGARAEFPLSSFNGLLWRDRHGRLKNAENPIFKAKL